MKILHVISTLEPRYGGPATSVPHMCIALVRAGHQVEIFTNLDEDTNLQVPNEVAVHGDGVTTTYFATRGLRSYPISIGMARTLRRRIADYDVVHVHGLYRFHTLLTCALCRRRGVPYVVQAHGTLDPYHRAIRRWRKALYCALFENRNLAGAAAIQYTSAGERTFAEEAGVRAPGYVIPLGVDPALLEDALGHEQRRDALARLMPEAQGRLLVTFLGRLTEKKGLDVLCEAFRVVSGADTRAHLVIAGPDDEGLGAEIRRWVAETRLQDHVSLPGIVTGTTKIALLHGSDVFVLPSKDESFGVAVIEALAARAAVVVTPGVALHDVLERTGAGLVVDRTPEAVAEAILLLVRDEGLRRRLGENGRSLVERSYSWDHIGRQLEQMYFEAIEKRAVSSTRRGGL